MYKNTKRLSWAHAQPTLGTVSRHVLEKKISELINQYGSKVRIRRECGTVAIILFPTGKEIYELWERV